MKKLITTLAAINLISGTSCAVVACDSKITNNKKQADIIKTHASKLNPSKKKASKITPAAKKITPSNPKGDIIKPSNPITGNAASIGHKIENRTIGLHGSFWLGKDIFDYHQQLADAIVKQGLLTKAEVQYVSWGHLLITENKLYHNINFTVKTYDATYVAGLIKLFVSESSQDIVDKLNKKTIKLNPDFWMNKNLQDYQAKMNDLVVQNKLLTKYETQYVHWNNFHVNQAKYYWNQAGFTVWKKMPQYGTSGKVTINASVGETTKVIAAKLEHAKITLNYNYWHGKNITNYMPLIRSILVNEKILTKTEASIVNGFLHPKTINSAGKLAVNFNINDDNTNTWAYTNISVLKDGEDAQHIANKIPSANFYLKDDTFGQYADSSYVTKNFRDLAYNYGYSREDMNNVTLPHIKLQQNNNNISAHVLKDGQTAQTTKFNLICDKGSQLHLYNQSYYDFQIYANITPAVVQNLKVYFNKHTATPNLGYFYQVLDDGTYDNDNLPYCDTGFIPWNSRLEILQNLGDTTFGDSWYSNGDIAWEMSNTDSSDPLRAESIKFEKDLKTSLNNAGTGYLSFMFHWCYGGGSKITDDSFYLKDYHIW